jgi:hypothetical protein
MGILRTTTIPTLAVCGSHQLVAAAFHGFSAVAHMNDEGEPVRVSTELAATPPAPLWPSPRVGEEGTYPLRLSPGAQGDPLVKAVAGHPKRASLHHKDMVVSTGGFILLFEESPAPPFSKGDHQAAKRCHVQGMKLEASHRLLYSVQFHPEIHRFAEATSNDEGFGRAFLAGFFDLAKTWWRTSKLVKHRSVRSAQLGWATKCRYQSTVASRPNTRLRFVR